MKGAIKIGNVRGIGVYIHWTFFLLLGYVAYSKFSESSSFDGVGGELLMVILVFGCVLLHEFGHALMAQRYHVKTRDITLLPMGGVARLEKMPEKPQQECMVALAGPLVNVGIILLLLPVILLGKGWPLALDMDYYEANGLLVNLLLVNISLLLFNLLPAFPMDGGRVLRSLLAMKLSHRRATKIAAYIGMAIAAGFIVLGVSYNVVLVLIGLFVFYGANAELRMTKPLRGNSISDIRRLVHNEIVLLSLNATVRTALEKIDESNALYVIVSDPEGKYAVLTVEDVLRCSITLGEHTLLSALPIGFTHGVSIETPPEVVLQKMLQDDCSTEIVTEATAIAGVISLRELQLLCSFREDYPAS
ncbi:MAG: site-2 protease family protein [Bacteroidia bacterium]